MTKLGMITAAVLLVGMAQAQAVTPMVPVQRVHAPSAIKNVTFWNCYADSIMNEQRRFARAGGVSGGLIWTGLATIGGGFLGVVVTIGCGLVG